MPEFRSQYALPPSSEPTKGPTKHAAALDYIAKHGGHASIVQNGRVVHIHPATAGAYKAVTPELAARLHAAGQAFEKETGKAPKYGELSRGEDVQARYWEDSGHGRRYAAAPPGRSRHQHGEAGDLPDSEFRKWLYNGNAAKFGLHFPVRNDAPHVQANPAFKGSFADTAAAEPEGPQMPRGVGAAMGGAAKAPGYSPDQYKRAFLDSIARGESKGYDYQLGGKRFSDYSRHPGGVPSGRYQFKPDTWDEVARQYGYKDFKPGTQDEAAWNYAKDRYNRATGRMLETDLASGDPKVLNNISSTLGKSTWTSLPGGSEPNSNWAGTDFATGYKQYLEGGGSGDTSHGVSVTAQAPQDPAPSGQGGIGSDAARTGSEPASVADSIISDQKKKDWGNIIGDTMQEIAAGMAKGGPKMPGSTPANATMAPTAPLAAIPTVDPNLVNQQRQQLAMALQRLNSGRLV